MSKSTVDKGPSHPGCHVSNQHVRAWPGWTLFSGSVGARALVCAVLHPLTPGVSVARPLLGFFPDHIRGRSGFRFQRNSELAFSNLSVPAVP